jgi:hypothetical protein
MQRRESCCTDVVEHRVKEVAMGTDPHAVHVTNHEYPRKGSSIVLQELRTIIFLFKSSIRKGLLGPKKELVRQG